MSKASHLSQVSSFYFLSSSTFEFKMSVSIETKNIGDDVHTDSPNTELPNVDESVIELPNHIERRVLRKLDFTMIPLLWFLFLVSFIDRGNIGNLAPFQAASFFTILTTRYTRQRKNSWLGQIPSSHRPKVPSRVPNLCPLLRLVWTSEHTTFQAPRSQNSFRYDVLLGFMRGGSGFDQKLCRARGV